MRPTSGLAVALALASALLLPAAPVLAASQGAKQAHKQKSVAAPAPLPIARPEDVLVWINAYRKAPAPERLPEVVHRMADLGLFRDLDQAGIYIGFIAGVLGANGDQARGLISRMFPMPPDDQVVLVRAIAYSNLPHWRELLISVSERMPARHVLIQKYLYGDGKTLAELPLDEGSYVLDVHWGYYFGSGAAWPVERIVSALAWTADRDSVDKLTIGSMAKWTLANNASRDKDLLDILKADAGQQPEAVQKPLKEVIEAAETFETAKIRKDALAAIDELKAKGPESQRKFSWWGTAGQTALAVGCVAATALGQVEVGIPCVVGGAVSSAALKYLAPAP